MATQSTSRPPKRALIGTCDSSSTEKPSPTLAASISTAGPMAASAPVPDAPAPVAPAPGDPVVDLDKIEREVQGIQEGAGAKYEQEPDGQESH